MGAFGCIHTTIRFDDNGIGPLMNNIRYEFKYRKSGKG